MKLLLTRPNHDALTRYLGAWAQLIMDLATDKNFDVFDLSAERANRKNVGSMLLKHKPDFVMLNGHGNTSTVTGQDDIPIIAVGENESALAGTVTYAVSCSSAAVLGPRAVAAGAKSYIGYSDDFFLEYELQHTTHPTNDQTAALFLGPSNQVMISLLRGHTPSDAAQAARAAFRRSIRQVISSANTSPSSSTASYLFWNYQNLVVAQ